MFFKRRKRDEDAGGVGVAERPPAPAEEWRGTDEELHAEIARLAEENRAARDLERERRLVWLRHLAGIRRVDGAPANPQHPLPDAAGLGEGPSLPEFTPEQLTPELLRAGILRDGCVLVRGLLPRDLALEFAEEIDRAFDLRDRWDEDHATRTEGYYEEWRPHERYGEMIVGRPWIKEGGGVLASDSPRLHFQMVERFAAAGLPELVGDYLGEPPLISAHKTTLRKADPSVGGAWHQDGAFMGPVRALNLWVSLSRCGDESPGLDLVPRRLEDYVKSGGEGTYLDFQISQQMAEQAAGDKGIIRPIFEPGDALFFDELFLHSTGSDPAMPKPRYAIENWFFGGSAFPADYAPIAV